jgi:hypothetical protein
MSGRDGKGRDNKGRQGKGKQRRAARNGKGGKAREWQ